MRPWVVCRERRSTHRLRLFCISFLVGSFLCSCKQDLSPIAEGTKNIQKGAEALSEGLKGVDPMGQQKLLRDNDNLRQIAESLRAQLNSTFAPASIGISRDSGFNLEITGSSGELWIDAWLDDPNHKFLQDQPIHDRDAALAISYNIADEMVNGTMTWCRKNGMGSACFLQYVYPKKSEQVDQAYKDAVNSGLQDFLKQPFNTPTPDVQTSAIQHWTRVTGEHQLHFRVTPKRLSKNGKWSLAYTTSIVLPNQTKQTVFQGAMSSERYGTELNKPVDIVATTFPIVVEENAPAAAASSKPR